jgi:hypothetical protein
MADATATPAPVGKEYLSYETARNHTSHSLFTDILHEAFGKADETVIGHHVCFSADGGDTLQEIPSADSMIFDHDIAKKIWGVGYKDVLSRLAQVPAEERDALLGEMYYNRAS